MKLRKRFKAQAGSKEVLEKQCKALQELCGKQRLEVDALTVEASQSGQLCHSQLQSINKPCYTTWDMMLTYYQCVLMQE